ncbi:hypothetical protein JZ751_028206 [Albula glossodonta]|uniref:Uncharacterized protein n=1 Tax=Albula glossodonta TaxID=121402 RepID=A0A8T2PJS0_9TELE|nr:hypothetical protein JZ751_028206 [Albula glossodonta]
MFVRWGSLPSGFNTVSPELDSSCSEVDDVTLGPSCPKPLGSTQGNECSSPCGLRWYCTNKLVGAPRGHLCQCQLFYSPLGLSFTPLGGWGRPSLRVPVKLYKLLQEKEFSFVVFQKEPFPTPTPTPYSLRIMGIFLGTHPLEPAQLESPIPPKPPSGYALKLEGQNFLQ